MIHKEYEDILVSVDNLEIGMHVVALDRPWDETPFLLQGFVIKSQQEVQELCRYCSSVYIQVSIENAGQFKANLAGKPPSITAPHSQNAAFRPQQGPASTRRVKYINQIGFEEAVEASRMTFDSARGLATSIMEGLRIGRSLDINECRKVVEDIVASVLDNIDALRFLSMIKDKDAYTAEHSMNVCILSATFARFLGLQEFEIKTVALCGLLHDVGKSRIPLEILNKPGRFTQREAYIMAEHTTHGRNILMSASGDHRHAVDVAHSHHERLDGKGYPRGLNGGQISYYTKIVAIVDAYDAMTSNRCYGAAKSSQQALDIINKARGVQFDPELAQAFTKCIGLYAAGCLVELEAGQLAIVIKANKEDYTRPKIIVVTDARQKRLKQEVVLDLMMAENQTVVIQREVANGTAGIDVKYYITKGLKLY